MINLLTIPIIPIAANTDNAFPVCKNSSIKKLPFLLQIVPDDIYYSRPSLVWEDENGKNRSSNIATIRLLG